ncbi:MAG: DNA repair protein RecN [Nocardioides sp.]
MSSVFEEITITGLGVIEASTLELGPGLTVITGETGAGKTMVVTALGLLLGGRADPGAVRHGTRSARVEGLVRVTELPSVAAAVTDAGGVVEDERVVLARTVLAEGRSRAFVGGATVPVASLGEVATGLVAVHGQSDQHRLLKAAAQREALDRFGGQVVLELRTAYSSLFQRLRAVERQLDNVVASRLERSREMDVLRFGLDEVRRVEPLPAEDRALAAQEARLAFADQLRTAAENAREALSSDEGSHDALGAVGAARTMLEDVRGHDPEAAALAERLAEVSYVVADLAADVASYAARLDSDPGQLASVSERRALLSSLTRKYGDDIDAVLAWATQAEARLDELAESEDRVDQLRTEQDDLRSALADTGAKLSHERAAAARRLGDAVTTELVALAMPRASLMVRVEQTPASPAAGASGPISAGDADREPSTLSPHALLVGADWVEFSSTGLDEVEFRLSANLGSEARSLAKGASGGELSRVMLALEVSLADTSPVPTFVFDEVDAGVGGKAAVEVGRRLARLARTSQVIVVTHLPQVAAYADRHIVVEKADDGSVTTSGLLVLDDGGRERELSRMLAGMEDSATGLEHARELLAAAQSSRPR